MRPDGRGPKGSSKKARRPRDRWQSPRSAAQAPRSWTNKTMHHPATRIGEIKPGKS
jgi:hypothetical protein